jgi:hypothetical protein
MMPNPGQPSPGTGEGGGDKAAGWGPEDASAIPA